MFLEHFTGFAAGPHGSGLPGDSLLDPLLLGVLTTALEDESTDAYQQGFRDGLRAAALAPTEADGVAESDDAAADELGFGESGLGEGDWHR